MYVAYVMYVVYVMYVPDKSEWRKCISGLHPAWIKPVCDGRYVNIQSDTGQKYIQLRSISDSLNLGLTV